MCPVKLSYAFWFALGLTVTLIWGSREPLLELGLGLLGIVLLSGAIILVSGSFPPSTKRWALVIFCLGLGCCLGLLRVIPLRGFPVPGRSAGLPREDISAFSGYLSQDSYRSNQGVTVYPLQLARVESPATGRAAEARGTVLVMVPGGSKLYLGQKVYASGRLYSSAQGNHFLCKTRAQGIRPSGFRNELLRRRADWRHFLWRRLLGLEAPIRGVVMALIFGDREEVPPTLYEGFRLSGSLHLLALSGLHLSILLGVIFLLLFFIPHRGLKTLFGALLGFLYLFLVGPRPSLLRAVVMLGGLGIAWLLDRDTDGMNFLSLAAALLLLIDPTAVFDLSFQLSFLALLGIIALGPWFFRFLSPYVPPIFSLPLAASLGAQLATAPVLMVRFGVIFPVGILAGLVLVPLVTLYIWSGLSYLIAACLSLPLLPEGSAWLLHQLHRVLLLLVRSFARVPGIHLAWRGELAWLILLAFMILALRSITWRRPHPEL